MHAQKQPGFFSNLASDLPASLVVFLVAVPLCLGIALASGAPLFSGIIAGIIGGIVVGSLSGSNIGVSGPAAGLAVIVFDAIKDLGGLASGGFELFLVAVMLAGLMQLALGYAKAGIIGYYFPNSVIKGMLSGIGIVIFLKQIPHAFGVDVDPEGDLAFDQPDGHNTFSELYYMIDNISYGAAIITAVSLLILILWEQKFMKRIKVFNIIQGPLVVVVTGILMAAAFVGSEFELTGKMMVSIPTFESTAEFLSGYQLPENPTNEDLALLREKFKQMLGLPYITLPNWTAIMNPKVWLIAAIIALVASLETLLCVEATDKIDPAKHVTPTNQELKAQGIGNIISGLIGGLPITQVIVRSSANMQSGGKTKASAVFHGVLLLIAAVTLPDVLNMIPYASLAAILFVVGYKLAKPAIMIAMYKKGWGQFIPFAVTVLVMVTTDLLIGVSVGLGVAIFFILYSNFKTPFYFEVHNHVDGEPYYFRLSQDVTFLNKASILSSLDLIPDGSEVVVDGSKTERIDQDVMEIFEEYKETAKNRNINFDLRLRTSESPDQVEQFRSAVAKSAKADGNG